MHDYQLQLVPGMLRELRPDVRIGFFNHIPFPGYEIFAQLPWRRQIVEGLLGADLIGFQRQSDATNFLRACRRAAGLTTRGALIRVPGPGGDREVRAAAFPISIDTAAFEELAGARPTCRPGHGRSATRSATPAWCCSASTGSTTPRGSCTGSRPTARCWTRACSGCPRRCWCRWPARAGSGSSSTGCCATRSRSRSGGSTASTPSSGTPPVHYLHQSYPREEMAALYLAADVMLVTSLRDGMNLVAKEYVACRFDETGALVLSEFTGAADELTGAFLVNPHDIEGLKETIVRAATCRPREARRRMRVDAPAGPRARRRSLGGQLPAAPWTQSRAGRPC